MAAVLYWRLPALTPTNPGPLPWLPGIPETLRSHPGWGLYLTKRSQLVADLADQIQNHAYQIGGPPVWAAPGSHPSKAPVPTTRTASQRAVRARPIAHLSRQIAALRT
jgi:hypothetical protein